VNFVWFAPYFEGSAIAATSNSVVAGLIAMGHGVRLIGTGGPPWSAAATELFTLAPGLAVAEEALAPFDAVIYNMGNHPSSYSIYRQAMRTPGLVILHDRFYADGLSGFAAAEFGDPAVFVQFARRAYGVSGLEFAQRVLSGKRNADDDERFPLWEPLVNVAQAVVVGSEPQAEEVRSRWSGPVLALPTPDGTPTSAACYGESLVACAAQTARRRVAQGAKAMVRRALANLGISDGGALEDRLCQESEALLADGAV
jgi:hypothetical protein